MNRTVYVAAPLVVALLVASMLADTAKVEANGWTDRGIGAVALPRSSSTISIENGWRLPRHAFVERHSDYSLGTVIGPRVILTHNHFEAGTGALPAEHFVFNYFGVDVFHLSATRIIFSPFGSGTLLLFLPDDLNIPPTPLADEAAVAGLQVGDGLVVTYWDDGNAHVEQNTFTILGIQAGTAKLADPERIINPGDSGGGVSFGGQLVGNIWSIDTDAKHVSVGSFNVALLPLGLVSEIEWFLK